MKYGVENSRLYKNKEISLQVAALLSIKRPLLRMLEQWENLSEYFFKFHPKESIFQSQIKTTNRYQRIVDFMKHPTSKASLCYIAFIANEFEDYLI